MRKPSDTGLRQIAEKTGFNISTVSRALNNRAGVSSAATRRILEAAREIGYRSPSRPVYAVILPATHDFRCYMYELLAELRRESLRRDIPLEFVFADQAEFLQERNLTGIISLDFNSKIVHHLNTVIPLVCLNNVPIHLDNIYSVSSDNAQGIREAVGLLVSHGHRKIGMFFRGGLDVRDIQERISAFEKCRELFALEPDALVLQNCQNPYKNYFYDSILSLIRRDVTAIICCGESESAEALAAIRLCGKKVPDDLSLICYEVKQFSRFLDPPLTTIEQDFPALAHAAFELLDQLIQTGSAPHDVIIDCRLHERSSVAIPPAAK